GRADQRADLHAGAAGPPGGCGAGRRRAGGRLGPLRCPSTPVRVAGTSAAPRPAAAGGSGYTRPARRDTNTPRPGPTGRPRSARRRVRGALVRRRGTGDPAAPEPERSHVRKRRPNERATGVRTPSRAPDEV